MVYKTQSLICFAQIPNFEGAGEAPPPPAKYFCIFGISTITLHNPSPVRGPKLKYIHSHKFMFQFQIRRFIFLFDDLRLINAHRRINGWNCYGQKYGGQIFEEPRIHPD